MAAPWYTQSGTPGTQAQGSSADMRAEFSLIETAMGKLPSLTADYIIKVNSSGTALESVAPSAVNTILGLGTTDSPTFAGLSLSSPLAVGNGGTGNTTLTSGGVLLGNGTGAIANTGVLADGAMLVGDGSGAPAIESGATLRTSIGVGTTDSPSFAGLSLSSALTVPNGGTGATSLTGLIKGSGTSALSPAVAGTDYVIPSGNVATATAWATARTVTIGGTGKSVNGTANVTWTLAEIGALDETEQYYTDQNAGSQTVTRQGKVTEIRDTSTSTRTKTLDYSTFSEDDIVIIEKIFETGLMTITTDASVIYIPDGTSAASHTIASGYAATVKMTRRATGWDLRIY